MYIAVLSLSSTHLIEGLVVLSTVDFFRDAGVTMKKTAAIADSKGGRVRSESMSTSGLVISVIHSVAFWAPPIIYVGALVANGFEQPKWFSQFALSDVVAGVHLDATWKNVFRVAACVGGLAVRRVMESAFDHLGEQWHSLGRRERPRVVQTGPYAWVRHPLYTAVLLQQALWSIAFWSYAPLVALGVTAASFAIKMPIEENSIMKDEGIREEYRAYMDKVPARILPCIW